MDLAMRHKLERRMDRRELWVSLWLARIVTCLEFFAFAPIPHAWQAWFDARLDAFENYVCRLILIRTAMRPEFAARTAKPARRKQGLHTDPHIALRAMIGGSLRRALKGKSFAERAANILRVLQNREVIIAKMARRFSRGLTRIFSAHTQVPPLHPSAALNGPPPPAARGEELRVAVAPP